MNLGMRTALALLIILLGMPAQAQARNIVDSLDECRYRYCSSQELADLAPITVEALLALSSAAIPVNLVTEPQAQFTQAQAEPAATMEASTPTQVTAATATPTLAHQAQDEPGPPEFVATLVPTHAAPAATLVPTATPAHSTSTPTKVPTSIPTGTVVPTATEAPTSTVEPTATATLAPSATPTWTPTLEPTKTWTATGTSTSVPTSTPTQTSTSSPTATAIRTATTPALNATAKLYYDGNKQWGQGESRMLRLTLDSNVRVRQWQGAKVSSDCDMQGLPGGFYSHLDLQHVEYSWYINTAQDTKLGNCKIVGAVYLLGLDRWIEFATDLVVTARSTPTATATKAHTATATATRTSIPTATATSTPAPAPYVQFLNPSHTISHPNGISYARASDATLSITGIGNRFDLALVRLSDGKTIASQSYKEVSTYQKQIVFCLFGGGNNCKGWPDELFLPGSYQFQAVAYWDTSYNSNYRHVFIDIIITMPTVKSVTEENGRIIIRGYGFRTYTGSENFAIEYSGKDVSGLVKPQWTKDLKWSDGEISFPKPILFPKNGTLFVWSNTLRSREYKFHLEITTT